MNTNRQINIRQYEFSLYYKPLALYHFVKIKIRQMLFEVNSSNLFPVNISGYTVYVHSLNLKNSKSLITWRELGTVAVRNNLSYIFMLLI